MEESEKSNINLLNRAIGENNAKSGRADLKNCRKIPHKMMKLLPKAVRHKEISANLVPASHHSQI